jgi:SNF2 family DNA or RNA helicase
MGACVGCAERRDVAWRASELGSIMKTKGMAHQLRGLELCDGRDYFAFFMEQGTGKTWLTLADAERMWLRGEIDAVFVMAPRGVHTNWVKREIPAHWDIHNLIARAWKTGAGKRAMERIEEVITLQPEDGAPALRLLSMNIDAIMTKAGHSLAVRFMRGRRVLIVLDESQRIKNPAAARSKVALRLRGMAHIARILSGTPINQAPMDVFSQMEFLRPGLLGTTSYRAFTAEFAELMSPNHPMMKELIRRNPKVASAQMVLKDADGKPRWKNLDKLRALLEPHSFRVLKKDCLDLPDKIYKTIYFDLSPELRKVYELMDKELRLELGGATLDDPDPDVLTFAELSAILKLQQITSGFVKLPGGEVKYVTEENPRLTALMEAVKDVDGKFIVWARFKEELAQIASSLRAAGIECVEYHGGISEKDREEAIDAFQDGPARAFVGQPQAGGVGITLTAAETAFYFSNDFNRETRRQSEDRNHRIGTLRHVVYIDLVADGTVDEGIVRALTRKDAMAALILGDADERRPAKIGSPKKGKAK